jgi:hypothetical protein
MAKPNRRLPEVLKATMWQPGQRGGPDGPEYVRGRGHFHSEALRMARAMTPAAIRRLGEFAGINPDTGSLIPLEEVDIDHRVMQISCLALIERTMGKAQQYDPAKDPDARPKPVFDPRPYTTQELLQLEVALKLLMEDRTVVEEPPPVGAVRTRDRTRRANEGNESPP